MECEIPAREDTCATLFSQGMECEIPAREDAGAPTRGRNFFRKAWNAKSQPARTRAHRRGGATFFARHGMRNPSPRGRGRTDAGAQLFSQGMECEIPAREDAGAPARGRHFSWPTFATGGFIKMKSMIIRTALANLLLSLAIAQGGEAGRATAAAQSRPNIIIIMSDDMGFSDIGCYGGEINTPNLDSLAANGVRFTQFYNTARCCPTRAALLTGLYPHQAGVGHMMEDRGHDGYRGDLNRNAVTIAEVLRPAGYATYAVGKWHVTKKTRAESEADKYNWPLQRGFERYYGTLTGAGSFWDPSALVRDNTPITAFADPEYQPKEPYYYTDAISDNASRFIAEHIKRAGDKPFFMYVAFTAAHWPMHARERDIAKYKGKYDQGYEPIRRARREKGVKLGLIDPEWTMAPQAGDWEKVTNKDWEARGMEVYSAMIDAMDQGVGRIIAELKRQGQFDNTATPFLESVKCK